MPRGLPPPLALAYHGVDDVPLRRDPDHLFVRPQDLRRQIEKLREWGYELVTFGELAADVRPGRAALTFDDGLVDNLTALVPILQELAAPATVFVVSGWLGQAHPAAPWTRIVTDGELRELRVAGVEIGGHSATHADLSALSYEDALDELRGGKKELEGPAGRGGRGRRVPVRAHEPGCDSRGQRRRLPRRLLHEGARLLGRPVLPTQAGHGQPRRRCSGCG